MLADAWHNVPSNAGKFAHVIFMIYDSFTLTSAPTRNIVIYKGIHILTVGG